MYKSVTEVNLTIMPKMEKDNNTTQSPKIKESSYDDRMNRGI